MNMKSILFRILCGFSLGTTGTAILADEFDLQIERAVQVSFQTESGKIYQIQSSLDIPAPDWQVEGHTIQGDGSRQTANFLTGETGRRIYRIQELLLKNGLVGYFPFNGNATDESGNGNDGIISGSTLGTNRFGVVGNSYVFTATGECCNWVGDFITTSNSNGFPTGTDDFTVSLWAKLSLFGPDYHLFFANRENNMFQLGLTVFSGNKAAIEFYSGPGKVAPDAVTPLLDWNLGEWHNIQITRASNVVTLFRDGISLVQSNVTSGNSASAGNLNLDFGWRTKPGAGGHPFWGQLDDFRIYNRALSLGEIKALNEIPE